MPLTLDFKIFKKHPLNRPLQESLVKRLVLSIENRNLLELRPINIDENYRVIDGQHRLEAAKRMNIPIYYELTNSLFGEDMIILNTTQKQWNLCDYVNYYYQKGHDEYIKLKNFHDEQQLNLSLCLSSLGDLGRSGNIDRIKNGTYKFPEEYKVKSIQKIEYVKKIIDILHEKIIGDKRYIRYIKFTKAIIEFSNKDVDMELFINKKLLSKINILRPCVSVFEYVQIFKVIYNYRNENPIT